MKNHKVEIKKLVNFLFFLLLSQTGLANSSLDCENIGDAFCKITVRDFATGQFCTERSDEKIAELDGYNCNITSREEGAKQAGTMQDTSQVCLDMLNRYKVYVTQNIVPNSFQNRRFVILDDSNYCGYPVSTIENRSSGDHHFVTHGSYSVLTPIKAKYFEEKIETKVRYKVFLDTNFQYSKGIQTTFEKCKRKKKSYFDKKNVYFSFCQNSFTENEYFSDVKSEGEGFYTATISTTLYTIVHSNFTKKHPNIKLHNLYDEESKKEHEKKEKNPLEKMAHGVDSFMKGMGKVQIFFGHKVK